MNFSIEDQVEHNEAFKLVQPTKSKDAIGISTRAFYDNLEKYKWEKVEGQRGAVFYKVPLNFIEQYSKPQGHIFDAEFETSIEDSVPQQEVHSSFSESELVSFMRETFDKVEVYNQTISKLSVENATYKVLTDGKDSEIEKLKALYFEEQQKVKSLEAQLKDKETTMLQQSYENEALKKQIEAVKATFLGRFLGLK